MEQFLQQTPSSPNLQWGVWFFARSSQVSAHTAQAVSLSLAVSASICSMVVRASGVFTIHSLSTDIPRRFQNGKY
jgi:hypothetical protein